MNYFIDYLNQLAPLSSGSAEAINQITIHKTISKHILLLQNGDVCLGISFSESGLARVFYDKDGKEVTAWFATANQIVSAIDSLFTGNPSQYNIEILEDSVV